MGQKPHLCFHLLCWSISYPIVLCGITVGFYYCKWEQNFLILSLKLSDYGPNCLFEWDKCMSLFKHIIKFLHNSFFCIPTLILQDFFKGWIFFKSHPPIRISYFYYLVDILCNDSVPVVHIFSNGFKWTLLKTTSLKKKISK